jgi:HlyD family secretion protein
MNKKILLPVAIVVAVAVVAAIWAWTAHRPAVDPDELSLYGNVDIRQVSLAFNASERISEIRVREGDKVRAGAVLAVLDERTPLARLAQGAAQIGVQEQALLRLQAGSRPEEIAQAKANLAAAQAEADLAARQVARLRSTSEATAGRAVSQQDLDAAQGHAQVAVAQAESLRKTVQLVVAGPRKEDIAQARNQLASARAGQVLIQRQIDESELHAPIDAVVRARLLEPGDMASPQRPVLTLAITEPKWVRAYVTESQLSRIATGMSAGVTTDSRPDRVIAARIGYISSVAEFTPKTVETPELRTSLVYEVRFMVDDPQDQLRLGMPATVHLRLPAATQGQSAKP